MHAKTRGFRFCARSKLISLNEKRPHKAMRAFHQFVIGSGTKRPDTKNQYIVVKTLRSFFISSKARPVPITTHDKGSSAMETGSPVA